MNSHHLYALSLSSLAHASAGCYQAAAKNHAAQLNFLFSKVSKFSLKLGSTDLQSFNVTLFELNALHIASVELSKHNQNMMEPYTEHQPCEECGAWIKRSIGILLAITILR